MELDIAIIGGGMAGLTAGLYAARGGKQVVVFEQFMPGGQTATIQQLDNYPGFAHGVDGLELMQAVAAQAEQAGCQLRYESVQQLSGSEGKQILTTDQGEYCCGAIIIATGAIPAKLGLPGEERLTGRGVSYCATCDGALYRGKTVAVVGGDNAALTDALVLAELAERVYLINRRDKYRAIPLLQQRVGEQPKITQLLRRKVEQLTGEDKLRSVVLRNMDATSLTEELAVDGLFVAIGSSPVTEFIHSMLELDAAGHIITDAHMATSRPGVFAAGDCRNTPLRQVVTAAADGAIAAMSALKYINTNR